MELENNDQYVNTLFLIEYFNDEINLINRKSNKLPLRKKLFLASFYHLKEDLENQIVNYEQSKTKSFY
jgi:hypothetical protein